MSSPKKTFAVLSSLLETAIDTLLPPRCVATGEIVDRQGMVSPAFWRELSFIESPFCNTCGLPFALDVDCGAMCAGCLAMPPDFDAARSAVVYNDASRKLVLNFKYGDRLQAVHTFTPWLMRAGGSLIGASDIIAPVPLHNKRLWQRRFNQSALIALALGRASGKPCLPSLLTRKRATLPQKGLSRSDRHMNVKGAFAVSDRLQEQAYGKTVLLVDDVFTSGATLNECARALKRAGAANVNVLTVARVTRDDFQ